MPDDKTLADLARQLAVALQDFAYTRKDEDRKRVNALQVELIRAVQQETKHDQPN